MLYLNYVTAELITTLSWLGLFHDYLGLINLILRQLLGCFPLHDCSYYSKSYLISLQQIPMGSLLLLKQSK